MKLKYSIIMAVEKKKKKKKLQFLINYLKNNYIHINNVKFSLNILYCYNI